MTSRFMVYLDADQLRALRKRAQGERVSVAELVRRFVRDGLARAAGPAPQPSASALKRLIGLGSSGQADVGDTHDTRLARALGREHLR